MSKTNKQKHKCCECGEIAVWFNEYNSSKKTKYYCDKCVPRGSICNVDNLEDFGEPQYKNRQVMWWDRDSLSKDLLRNGSLERNEKSFYYEILDECGRRNPSDDFIFQDDGFSKLEEEKTYLLCYDDILESIDIAKVGLLTYKEEFEITDVLENIFLKHRSKEDGYTIEYNTLMSKFGNYLTNKFASMFNPNVENWRIFYIRFKEVMTKAKCLVE